MSIHKSLMLSHFNCSIMTTTTCKNQEGYNKVGEIYEVIEEDYSEVVANVLDVFVKYKEFYPVLVEVKKDVRATALLQNYRAVYALWKDEQEKCVRVVCENGKTTLHFHQKQNNRSL
ncbi:hypothetical protein GBAR_LOCUS20480, partial [Geodia barretti]